MGLDEVKKDIINGAEKQATEILQQAEQEATAIKNEAEKEIKELEKHSNAKIDKDLVTLENKELALAKLEAKKYSFERKKQIINEVTKIAGENIIDLKQKNKLELLKKLVKKASSQIDVEYVYCNSSEISLVKKIAGKKMKLVTCEISGGIIAENKEKSMRVDYSYDTLLQEVYDNLLQELATTLFWFSSKQKNIITRIIRVKFKGLKMDENSKIRLQECYPYTYVRATTMRAKLLGRDDYNKLLKMGFAEIAKYLEDSEYKKDINELATGLKGAELLEAALNRNLVTSFEKLWRISPDELDLLINAYVKRYDFFNIKTIIRGRFSKLSKDEIHTMLKPIGLYNDKFYRTNRRQRW